MRKDNDHMNKKEIIETLDSILAIALNSYYIQSSRAKEINEAFDLAKKAVENTPTQYEQQFNIRGRLHEQLLVDKIHEYSKCYRKPIICMSNETAKDLQTIDDKKCSEEKYGLIGNYDGYTIVADDDLVYGEIKLL